MLAVVVMLARGMQVRPARTNQPPGSTSAGSLSNVTTGAVHAYLES